jgi:periplasmic protein TonB
MYSTIKIIFKIMLLCFIIISFTQCSNSQQTHKTPIDYINIDNELGDTVHTFVKEMPQFPGGDKALYENIGREINYPIYARRMGIEGKICVQFVVTKEGNVANVQIAKGIDYGCDNETIRVVKLLPKWIPGKRNGIPVNVRIQIPIIFKLQ